MALAPNEPKYEIEASDFRCRRCESEVPCEARYYSAISYGDNAFHRLNYCDPCWKAGGAGPSPGGASEGTNGAGPSTTGAEVFAFWRTRRPPLPTDRPKKIRFDTRVVFEFFRRLGGTSIGGSPGADGEAKAATPDGGPSREEREELRFVLSLLLVRKKVFRFLNSYQKEGSEWLELAVKEPRETHWVRNPDLADAQLERVKERIGELLQMQL